MSTGEGFVFGGGGEYIGVFGNSILPVIDGQFPENSVGEGFLGNQETEGVGIGEVEEDEVVEFRGGNFGKLQSEGFTGIVGNSEDGDWNENATLFVYWLIKSENKQTKLQV